MNSVLRLLSLSKRRRSGGGGGGGFDPADLPGLIARVPFDEGEGLVAANTVGRSAPYLNILPAADTWRGLWPTTFNANWGEHILTGAADPDGGTTGIRWTSLGDTGLKLVDRFSEFPAGTFTLSVWVKSNTGSPQTATLYIGSVADGFDVVTMTAAVGSWTRFSATRDLTAGSREFGIQGADGVAIDMLFWGLQLEEGATPTDAEVPNLDVSLLNQVGAPAWQNGGVSTGGSRVFSSGGSESLADFTLYFAARQGESLSTVELLFTDATNTHYVQLHRSDADGITLSGTTQGAVRTATGLWHVYALVNESGAFRRLMRDGVEEMVVDDVGPLVLDGRAGWLQITGEGGYSLLYDEAQDLDTVRQVSDFIAAELTDRAGAELVAGPPAQRVVWIGDSITRAYPGITSRGADGFPYPVRHTAVAKDGDTIFLHLLAADRLLAMERAVRPSGLNVAIVHAGTNDLSGVFGVSTAAQVYADLQTLVGHLRSYGYDKVAVATCLPRTGIFGSGVDAAAFETLRNDFNGLVVAGWAGFADALIDYASDAVMGDDATCANTNYYLDGVHPAPGGYDLMYPYAEAALTAMLA